GRWRPSRWGRRWSARRCRGPARPELSDFAKQFEELASLKQALNKVPDLSGQQKDSVKSLERKYGEIFKSYGIAARTKVDSARAAGESPDMEAIRTLRESADSVRTGEFALARAVLTSDAQRSRFDQNVVDIQAEAAKREEEMQKRRASGGAGRGGMGGGGMGGGGMRPPR
ncbi:MAG: hypothetical protein JWL95_1092, partial [Gemmatimonadetes bacterium]|nr:hypothetical protein [Gemmatimonadota bacterium]